MALTPPYPPPCFSASAQPGSSGNTAATATSSANMAAAVNTAAGGGSNSGTQLDTAQIEALEGLAPAATAVTAAASTLKDMLDPRTTSIILKAQNDLDQQLALGQLKRLRVPSAAARLEERSMNRPVTRLASHLVNMEKGTCVCVY
jgi:hypothetical protein